MSRIFEIDKKSLKERKKISEDLEIRIENNRFGNFSIKSYKSIYPLDVVGGIAYIPFYYGRKTPRPPRDNFSEVKFNFVGNLREEQKVVRKEAFEYLNKRGSVIIAAYPGFGKSCTALYIATKIKLKTLIISHRIVLIKQWKEVISKFCPNSGVQILTSKSKFREDCDFYIMNATNVWKHSAEFYKNIGFLIVDEVHCIMAEGLSKCMTRIVPRYLLGLSATPYREDGLNILLDLYFGPEKIYRKLNRKHTVYKIETNYVPTVEYGSNGKINWSVVLDSQANNIDRNEMIINIVKSFPNRVFLILCKRVNQGKYLFERLGAEGEDVTSLIGKQQEYEKKSRILVGTASKTGTGFDHSKLDALIIAGDIQAYFIQYLGRVFRTKTGEPIIFDIIDKNPILKRHFANRSKIYLEHGGIIKDFPKGKGNPVLKLS